MLEQGKSVRSLLREGQRAAETTCDELTVTPIAHPPAPLGGRRERNRVKLSSERKEGWGKVF